MKTAVIPLAKKSVGQCVLFSAICAIIIYALYYFANNPIYYDDDTTMSFTEKTIIMSLAFLILLGSLNIVFNHLTRYITKQGSMTLDSDGIHNTFIMFNILAFWTTVKIDFIPWSALKHEEGYPPFIYKIRDEKLLIQPKASRIALHILKSTGFNILIGNITVDEFENYRTGKQI